jgi:hypothetical protein
VRTIGRRTQPNGQASRASFLGFALDCKDQKVAVVAVLEEHREAHLKPPQAFFEFRDVELNWMELNDSLNLVATKIV